MTDYSLMKEQLEALTESERFYLPNLANASALIYDALPDLNWAGFYLVDQTSPDKELVLGPFQGKTACIRIPYGKGVCGTAYQKDAPLIVDDVHLFPGHIACDSASNSEIVIPLHDISKEEHPVVGVLDIDSPLFNRFSKEDEAGLAALCLVLEQHCDF